MKSKYNKKILIGILIIIQMLTVLFSINSIQPLIPKKSSTINIENGNYRAELSNNEVDIKSVMSNLYNITKEIHPVGSKADIQVEQYIIEQLEEMKVSYTEQQFKLSYDEIYEQRLNNFKKTKQSTYDGLAKKVDKKYNSVDDYIRDNSEYDNFEEFYKKEVLEQYGCSTVEELAQQSMEKTEDIIYKSILSNVIVKLGNNNNKPAILVSVHYDSDINSYGASDNGINVASALEMIRVLKNGNIDNNVYIIFTDGEEIMEGLWGVRYFVKNSVIDDDIELVINLDNIGRSGNLIMYQTSNGNYKLLKSYLKSVKNEYCYSIFQKLYEQGDFASTDANIYIENGYTVLNFALVGNNENYHSQNDTYENIEVDTVKQVTNTLVGMVRYYANNDISNLKSDENAFYFTVVKGCTICCKEEVNVILSIILIFISVIFEVISIKKNGIKGENKIIVYMSILTILSILSTIFVKDLTFIFTIPLLFILISRLIKNENAKNIYNIVTYLIYAIMMLQLLSIVFIGVIKYNKLIIPVIVFCLTILIRYFIYIIPKTKEIPDTICK